MNNRTILQKYMLFINMLTAFHERMKYDNNMHYFNITLKNYRAVIMIGLQEK